ncbi:fibrous sheath CABYR-binding protein-like isoform X2 [Frankliniella occidentalis]|uniref:Fibrous sheath CABYR-binding protein-like isoform X2 n=1 Tax=Frankliniella occidentalis TaxID=133901 RepID=A0A9C6XU05_FRAOC|nr:fibrous sheath CABYR-binding protein-like isoform X2 [Frankliniella occidentalis]
MEEPPAPPGELLFLLGLAEVEWVDHQDGDDLNVLDMCISPPESPPMSPLPQLQQEVAHPAGENGEEVPWEHRVAVTPPRAPARLPTPPILLSPPVRRAEDPVAEDVVVHPVGVHMARRREQIRRAAMAAAAAQQGADGGMIVQPAGAEVNAVAMGAEVRDDLDVPPPPRSPGRISPEPERTPPASPGVPAPPPQPQPDHGDEGAEADWPVRRGRGRPRRVPTGNTPERVRRPVGRPPRVHTGHTPERVRRPVGRPPRRPRQPREPREQREPRARQHRRRILPIGDMEDDADEPEERGLEMIGQDVGPEDVIVIDDDEEDDNIGGADQLGGRAPAPVAVDPNLAEFRRVRAEQEEEYNAGLAVDQERQRLRQEAEREDRERAAADERLREALAARRAEAVAAMEALGEVGDGDGDVYEVAFVSPSGQRWSRLFRSDTLLQNLRTAVEAREETPWGFRLRSAEDNEVVDVEYADVTLHDFFVTGRRVLLRVEEDDEAPPPVAPQPNLQPEPQPNQPQPAQQNDLQPEPQPNQPQPAQDNDLQPEPQPNPLQPAGALPVAPGNDPQPWPTAGPANVEGTCVICLEARSIMAFVPCGHVQMCEPCSKNWKRHTLVQNRKCTICRKVVKSFLKLYFA